MSAAARFEVVTTATDQHFARFIAANGKEVWRTSETYKRKGGAENAICCFTGHFIAHHTGWSEVRWDVNRETKLAEVRYIDERVTTNA